MCMWLSRINKFKFKISDGSNLMVEDLDTPSHERDKAETQKKRSHAKRIDEQQLVLDALEKFGSQDELHVSLSKCDRSHHNTWINR
jgi:hypothetical protein